MAAAAGLSQRGTSGRRALTALFPQLVLGPYPSSSRSSHAAVGHPGSSAPRRESSRRDTCTSCLSSRHFATSSSPSYPSAKSSSAARSTTKTRTTATAKAKAQSATDAESTPTTAPTEAGAGAGSSDAAPKPKRKRRTAKELAEAARVEAALAEEAAAAKAAKRAAREAAVAAAKAERDKAAAAAAEGADANVVPTTMRGRRRKLKPGEIIEADADSDFPHLPSSSLWRDSFRLGSGFLRGHRYFVSNPDTCRAIVEELRLGDGWPGKPVGDKERLGWTVIEAYAGPGTLTRNLLAHPAVDKVISLEENDSFASWVETLSKDQALTADPSGRGVVPPGERFSVLRSSAYLWTTYTDLVDQGLLAHLDGRVPAGKPESGETVSFTSKALPNTVHGEQLFAQLVHAISSRMWLFQYGRMKMAFICAETLAMRAVAQPGTRFRGKLSCTVQTLTDLRLAMPSSSLDPYSAHFYPSAPLVGPRLPASSNQLIPRSVKTEASTESKERLCLVVVEPRREPMVQGVAMDAFEFVTRNLFVLRTRPVEEALKHLAPGASNILAQMQPDSANMVGRPSEECISAYTRVDDLTEAQWVNLARTFEKWPFRPAHLFEEGRSDPAMRSGFMR